MSRSDLLGSAGIPPIQPEGQRLIVETARTLVGLPFHERFARAANAFEVLRQQLIDDAACNAPLDVLTAEAMAFAVFSISTSYALERGADPRAGIAGSA
jgi:hypothetical protein